jgi:hypothetical protein
MYADRGTFIFPRLDIQQKKLNADPSCYICVLVTCTNYASIVFFYCVYTQ